MIEAVEEGREAEASSEGLSGPALVCDSLRLPWRLQPWLPTVSRGTPSGRDAAVAR